MANTSSAKKQIRAQARKQVLNKIRSNAYRDARKQVKAAVESGDKAGATKALSSFYKAVDKAAKEHTLHANTAGRYKSRLTKLANHTKAVEAPVAKKAKAKTATKLKTAKK